MTPKITWEYLGEELALFWINPWNMQKEKIATFWWPIHPMEETERVEQLFESIARRASLGADIPINEAEFKNKLGPSVLEMLVADSAEDEK